MSEFFSKLPASLTPTERWELSRQAFFVAPENKKNLHKWIKLFLGLDFPDTQIDKETNSSPMDMIWETYNHLRLGGNEKFTRVLYYSSRDSYKTLGAAVLEVAVMVLLGLNVAHMAAIKDQSLKAQEYVRKFFNRPILRDYVTRRSERRVEFTRPDFAKDIKVPEPDGESNYIQILICTMQGVNFDHVPFMVIDEVDVVAHPEAYEEAKFIPAPYKGCLPVTLLTSTRKFSFGLVQKEIDEQEKTEIQIRKWNIVDVTEACPPDRHLSEESKIPIYRSDDTLRSIPESEYVIMGSDDQKKYVRDVGYVGCLKNCKLFAACKGKLATEQTSTSPLLKPIAHVIAKFREVSPDKAKAQLLCWKPSKEGLIYKTLERHTHLKDIGVVAELIDDMERGDNFSKADFANFIMSEIIQERLRPVAGIDWGDTHNFVFVFGVIDLQKRLYIIECLSIPELDIDKAVLMCKELVLPYCAHTKLRCYADSAYPMHIRMFKKAGWRVRGVKKYAGSVVGGIENVRTLLMNATGETDLFFITGNPGVDFLFKNTEHYHWKLDAAGRPTKEPDEEDDDECFTKDTEVLTIDGWKSLKNVSTKDKVATISVSGTLVFEQPTKTIKKIYTGNVYSIKDHPHLEFVATEGHLHAVTTQTSHKKEKVFNLRKKSIADLPSESYWQNNFNNLAPGDGFFEQGSLEAWFMGFWLAEGCFDTNRPTFLIVDQSKPKIIRKIKRILNRLGWTYSITKIKNKNKKHKQPYRFIVSGQKDRVLWYKENLGSGAANKRLGYKFILNMTHKERLALWKGYMDGDGSRFDFWHFGSISKELVDNIQFLTLSLGYGCRIVQYSSMKKGIMISPGNGKIYKTKDFYRAHILRNRPTAHIKKGRFTKSYVKNLPVYCVNTTTGFFLARTNGKVFVAGNCDGLRYLIMEEFGKGKAVGAAKYSEQEKAMIKKAKGTGGVQVRTFDNWMSKTIQDKIREAGGDTKHAKGRAGSIMWDMSTNDDFYGEL